MNKYKLEISFDLMQALNYINQYIENGNIQDRANHDICNTIINLLKLSMKK